MLLISLPLANYANSSLSLSAQEINAIESNETSTLATLITKNQTGNVNHTTDNSLMEKSNQTTKANTESNDTKALGQKGHALLKLKNFNEAIALFDKALAIKPNNTDVLNFKRAAVDALSRNK